MPEPEEGTTTTPAQSNNTDDGGEEAQADKVKDVLDDDTPAQSGAPESYGEFTVPEGFEFNGEHLEQFTGLAKKNGLSKEAAQDFVSYYANIETAKAQEAIKTINKWADEAKADPKIVQSKVLIKQVLSTAPESLYKILKKGEKGSRGFLHDSGLTNNPDFLRWVISIGKGKSIQEQPLINGEPRGTPQKTGLDRVL
jgi:hypothetical protein